MLQGGWWRWGEPGGQEHPVPAQVHGNRQGPGQHQTPILQGPLSKHRHWFIAPCLFVVCLLSKCLTWAEHRIYLSVFKVDCQKNLILPLLWSNASLMQLAVCIEDHSSFFCLHVLIEWFPKYLFDNSKLRWHNSWLTLDGDGSLCQQFIDIGGYLLCVILY